MKITVSNQGVYEQLTFAIKHHEQMVNNCRYDLADKLMKYINDINFERQNTFFRWIWNGFKIQSVKEISVQDVLDFFDNNSTDTKDHFDIKVLIYIPYRSDYWSNHLFSNRRVFNLVQKIKKLNTMLRMIEINEDEQIEINEEDFGLIWYD